MCWQCWQVAEYENCRLLLVDKKISTARDIVGVLEGAIRGGFPLMIMAEDIEQEALATLVVNKLRGRCAFNCWPSPAGIVKIMCSQPAMLFARWQPLLAQP